MVSIVNPFGYIISSNGVAVDPAKVQAIAYWPIPITLTSHHSFLGLASFCRRFIKDFSQIVAHLVDLIHLKSFEWFTMAQLVFPCAQLIPTKFFFVQCFSPCKMHSLAI